MTVDCQDTGVSKPKKIFRVPELIVGFDTETTGLDVRTERAISYGFCEYRYGQLVRDEEFYVLPDRPIADAARRVHGLSVDDIEAKRSSATVLSVEAGLLRALGLVRDYHSRGAFFVGANIFNFDFAMLRHSAQSVLGSALDDRYLVFSLLRTIDVRDHDLAIEPDRTLRPRRSLEHLCQHYGITSGGHDALADARASVEVFFQQVITNNDGQMMLELMSPTEDLGATLPTLS